MSNSQMPKWSIDINSPFLGSDEMRRADGQGLDRHRSDGARRQAFFERLDGAARQHRRAGVSAHRPRAVARLNIARLAAGHEKTAPTLIRRGRFGGA